MTESLSPATVAEIVTLAQTALAGQTAPVLLHAPDGSSAAPVLVLPSGLRMHSLAEELDKYRKHPERRKGTSTAETLDSFIELTKRFMDPGSAIFVRNDPKAPTMTAVLDYHPIGADQPPRFGQHRLRYAFPISPEWQAWTEACGDWMDQGSFAALIEDRIDDILPPPDLNTDPAAADLKSILRVTGGKIADQLEMIALSKGIKINESAKAEHKVDLQSGAGTLVYQSEHMDGSGNKLEVPPLFLIGIPVFARGTIYRLPVKLRYRLAGGTVKWRADLHRPDKVFEHAFEQACTQVQEKTALPLYHGHPEQ